MRQVRSCLITAVAALALSAPAAAPAADLHVGPGQPYATIQAAVDAAVPLDQIVVHDGIYAENVSIAKPLAVRSLDFLTFGENDGAVLDAGAAADTLHGIEVLSSPVVIEGLSIHGALGMTADYQEYLAAIVLREGGCTVAHNRLGWDDAHGNSLGIMLDDADATTLRENEILGVMHGIWMDASRACDVIGNDVHGAVNSSYSGGLYIMGDYAAPDPEASSGDNVFIDNRFHGNFCGIYLLATVWWNTFARNEFSENYIGVYVAGGCHQNLFVENTVRDNTNRGFHLRGTSYNAIVRNTIDNNQNGIWFGFLSPSDNGACNNTVHNNTIVNNSYAGIRISPHSTNNRMSLNQFAGNVSNVISEGTEWSTATPVSYFYATNHRNQLGNYYDTYTGADTDGDGVGDTDLPFIDGDPDHGPVEYFPLVAPPAKFLVQAWYAHGSAPLTMHRQNVGTVPGQVEVPAHSSLIWISDEPARGSVTFPAGAWTGQVSFVDPPWTNSLLVEVGSSSDGADFTASGAQALVGDDWSEPFTTSAAAVAVPEGHYLALHLTNSTDYACTLRTGGTNVYVSSPGLGDPLWPSGWMGDVPAPAGSQARLAQNQPNPFNPGTTIAFELDAAAAVELAVYDLSGRLVRPLLAGRELAPGRHEVAFDGRDGAGRALAAGVYFYCLRAGDEVLTRRMALVR